MTANNLPSLKSALLKIVGVFSYNPKVDTERFVKEGQFKSMPLLSLPENEKLKAHSISAHDAIENTRVFEKNTYYREFRGLMLSGETDDELPEDTKRKSARNFIREKELHSKFIRKNGDLLHFISPIQELYLFPDGVGLFSMHIVPENFTLEGASAILNEARNFSSSISVDGTDAALQFHQWISSNILINIPLSGNEIAVDQYSGSKFKVFSVYEIEKPEDLTAYNAHDLLYELGANAPLNSIANGHFLAPSSTYYDEIMNNNCFSAFRNYEMLSLLDSFTVIGWSNFNTIDSNYLQYNTWNKSYFSLYVFNLYIRYTLFRFNANFLKNPVQYRSKFEEFLNYYNLRHISFNFLPNMIFERMRYAMGVEKEIEQFEKRLKNLALSIQEQQEKRQAFLLTLISLVSSLEAVDIIVATLKTFQKASGLPVAVFYSILVLIIALLATQLIRFLFPMNYERYKKKFKKLLKKIYLSKRSNTL